MLQFTTEQSSQGVKGKNISICELKWYWQKTLKKKKKNDSFFLLESLLSNFFIVPIMLRFSYIFFFLIPQKNIFFWGGGGGSNFCVSNQLLAESPLFLIRQFLMKDTAYCISILLYYIIVSLIFCISL